MSKECIKSLIDEAKLFGYAVSYRPIKKRFLISGQYFAQDEGIKYITMLINEAMYARENLPF